MMPDVLKSREKRWISHRTRRSFTMLSNANSKRGSSTRPPLPADVVQHLASFLQFDAPCRDMIFVCGGRNEEGGILASAEMFDTWHGKWVELPNMRVRRAGTSAAPLIDKRLIVVGGYDERGITTGLLRSTEIFNPLTRTWEFGADMCRSRWGHSAVALGDYVYVVGGCSLRPGMPQTDHFMQTLKACEAFDPRTGTWREIAALNTCRAGARIAACGSRYLVAVGGCDDVFGHAEMLNTCEIYDAVSDQWTMLDTQLSIPRTTAAVACIGEGKLMVVGGAPNLKSCEIVDLPGSGRTFTEMAQVPAQLSRGRMGCQAVCLTLPEDCSYIKGSRNARRVVIVLGGEDGENYEPHVERQFNTMEVFDIEAESWNGNDKLPPMKCRRTAMAVCVSFGLVAPIQVPSRTLNFNPVLSKLSDRIKQRCNSIGTLFSSYP